MRTPWAETSLGPSGQLDLGSLRLFPARSVVTVHSESQARALLAGARRGRSSQVDDVDELARALVRRELLMVRTGLPAPIDTASVGVIPRLRDLTR